MKRHRLWLLSSGKLGSLESVRRTISLVAIFGVIIVCSLRYETPVAATQEAPRFSGATSSQPLALTADCELLLVVNPDNNSVTVFDVKNDKNHRLAEVPVGVEPWGVAVLLGGKIGYVANTVSGTVSVIQFGKNKNKIQATQSINVGTEPYGLVMTP